MYKKIIKPLRDHCLYVNKTIIIPIYKTIVCMYIRIIKPI